MWVAGILAYATYMAVTIICIALALGVWGKVVFAAHATESFVTGTYKIVYLAKVMGSLVATARYYAGWKDPDEIEMAETGLVATAVNSEGGDEEFVVCACSLRMSGGEWLECDC